LGCGMSVSTNFNTSGLPYWVSCTCFILFVILYKILDYTALTNEETKTDENSGSFF
jgi:hypothetical protein